MTNKQFKREIVYQVTMSSVRIMLGKGIITEEEYTVIDTIMLEKYTPLLGGIYR